MRTLSSSWVDSALVHFPACSALLPRDQYSGHFDSHYRVAELPSVHTPSWGVTIRWHLDFFTQLSDREHVPSALRPWTCSFCSLLVPHFFLICGLFFFLVMSMFPMMALEHTRELPNGGKQRRLWRQSERLHLDMTHRAVSFKFNGNESIIHTN